MEECNGGTEGSEGPRVATGRVRERSGMSPGRTVGTVVTVSHEGWVVTELGEGTGGGYGSRVRRVARLAREPGKGTYEWWILLWILWVSFHFIIKSTSITSLTALLRINFL